MTDAALPVTERAVERFTDAYLTSLGADITKDGRRWSVTLPDSADTELELDGGILEIVEDPSVVGEDVLAIAPESPFVERLLNEAAKRTPIGSLTLTGDQTEVRLPPWITAGSVEAAHQAFTPYYDRRALCALFHVGIETVSEYQQEELYAVAIDLNDAEERPRLAETYLELTDSDRRELTEGDIVTSEIITDAIETAQDTVEGKLTSTVREIREGATRAAEVELDEYRQFVRQRRDELTHEIDRLTTRIEDATETIDAASKRDARVEALRERKNLQAELDDLRAEQETLTSQLETGFPEKRREIRERHALTVRIRPVTATAVSYERGDLELTLQDGSDTITRSFGYAVGTGVIEEETCERCGSQLTEKNPLSLKRNQITGAACCDE
jgi:Skp family chaperone for outer membrane proteins